MFLLWEVTSSVNSISVKEWDTHFSRTGLVLTIHQREPRPHPRGYGLPVGGPREICSWQLLQKHASIMLKVILQVPPFPFCTKEQTTVLLLGHCPAPAPPTLPVYGCTYSDGRHNSPSGHPGGAATPLTLQTPSHATANGKKLACEVNETVKV